MKTPVHLSMQILIMILFLWPVCVYAHAVDSASGRTSSWYLSFQYLGITYHPDGGSTPEIYPLKLDKKAYLVINVGVAANLDYSLGRYFFLRFTSSLYKDCAFVTAGCFHFGPRVQYGWKKNRINLGIGPILSYRDDWHQFKEYQNDDFYGDRVYGHWQYRLFLYAVEVEYLRRINDHLEFQYSLVPGAPLVFTSLLGIRFRL
jgi:hypothetical protein